jgi:predicted PurR-regulated permease PerM
MIEDLSRKKRNWVLLGLTLLLLWFAWSIRSVINPLLLGYLFAYILLPLIRRVELRGFSHTTSVLAVFAGAALAGGLLFAALFTQTRGLITDILAAAPHDTVSAPGLPGQSEFGYSGSAGAPGGAGSGVGAGTGAPGLGGDQQATPALTGMPGSQVQGAGQPVEPQAQPTPDPGAQSAAPEGLSARSSWFERQFQRLRGLIEGWFGPGLLPETLPDRAEWLTWARQNLVDDPGTAGAVRNVGVEAITLLMEGLRRLLQSLFGISNLALLVPLYAFFMMFEIERIHRWVRLHLPVRYRAQLVDVGGRIGDIVSNFFRGRLVLASIKSLMLTVPLWLLGVPYSALIGIAGGLLSLLPFIGALLAFVLGCLAASMAYPWWLGVVLAGVVFGLAEFIEGYVLVPKIMGKSLGLSEVAVLFAITAGGAALGFFGVIVALPLAATLKVLFLEFVEPALKQFADEEPTAKGS